MLRGMQEAVRIVYGKRALLARRKEVVPDHVHEAIFDIPEGTRLAPNVVVKSSSHKFHTLCDAAKG